eukprot:TRINITY_DN67966_c0_g1_i1.p1 TRINITY_DN67966_c0_g1~~TRINITY_DN67966_c0_g1_i1.p1  ORF type:complete len:312 (+),score=22.32 TRINITY_DN67966_c0_g1_i1:69-1004(+)
MPVSSRWACPLLLFAFTHHFAYCERIPTSEEGGPPLVQNGNLGESHSLHTDESSTRTEGGVPQKSEQYGWRSKVAAGAAAGVAAGAAAVAKIGSTVASTSKVKELINAVVSSNTASVGHGDGGIKGINDRIQRFRIEFQDYIGDLKRHVGWQLLTSQVFPLMQSELANKFYDDVDKGREDDVRSKLTASCIVTKHYHGYINQWKGEEIYSVDKLIKRLKDKCKTLDGQEARITNSVANSTTFKMCMKCSSRVSYFRGDDAMIWTVEGTIICTPYLSESETRGQEECRISKIAFYNKHGDTNYRCSYAKRKS